MTPEIPSSVDITLVRPMPTARIFELADVAVLGAVLLAASAHLTIKAGLNGAVVAAAHSTILQKLVIYFTQPLIVLGLAVYGVGTLLWILAVSKRDISYVFPIAALNYVLVMVGGMVLFAESIPPKRWVGIAVVIFGVVLMQTAGRKGTR